MGGRKGEEGGPGLGTKGWPGLSSRDVVCHDSDGEADGIVGCVVQDRVQVRHRVPGVIRVTPQEAKDERVIPETRTHTSTCTRAHTSTHASGSEKHTEHTGEGGML